MAEVSQWNRPKKDGGATAKGSSYSNRKGRPLARGLLAALVVVIGGVLAFYFICGRQGAADPTAQRPTAPTEKKRGKIAEVDPAKIEKPKSAKPKSKAKPVTRHDTSLFPADARNCTAITNKEGEVNLTWQTPDGKWHGRSIPPPPVFDNVVDQTLSISLSVKPGHSLPPMPALGPGADEEFAKALKKPIVISEKDSAEVRHAKELVQEGRDVLRAEIEAGRSVNEVLSEYFSEVNNTADLRAEANRVYHEMLNDGETEVAERYRIKANEVLEKAGALTIKSATNPQQDGSVESDGNNDNTQTNN